MPIEFACQCGAKFRVAESMAGKSARCNACQAVVVVPQPVAVAAAARTQIARPQTPAHPPKAASAGPAAVDPQMWRELEKYNQNSQSAASNPGLLRINFIKFTLSFPKWPAIWPHSCSHLCC